jgi:hypothetical protein
MGFISKKGLINLANWKYEGAPYTPLENIMNPFWNWMASWIPATIAPNAVTLSALLWTITAVVACLVHDSTFEAKLPWYLYIFGGFSIFAF